MAIEKWELEGSSWTPPSLQLVPAPPRRGRVVPALVFVALLVATLGAPVVDAALKEPPRGIAWTPRPLPASQIAALDPVRPTGSGDRPRSSEPLGGILFVRCTNLWTALPDGTRPRKLLQFPGISSPSFSPDARTIAFVAPGERGPSLFMAAADGTQVTEIGSFDSEGAPVTALVSNLTWSPSGDKMVFSLVDPSYDPWVDGSSVWLLDLATGGFERIGSGSPNPAFADHRPTFTNRIAKAGGGRGHDFTSPWSRGQSVARRMSTREDDITFGSVPNLFSDGWATRHGLVVLQRAEDGELTLAVKADLWNRKIHRTLTAPSPYEFMAAGRVSMSEDANRAIVDLRDSKGDRALGVVDVISGQWRVLDYAWSGAASTAVTASGPVGGLRAQRLAGDIFGSLSRKGRYTPAALLVGDRDRDRLVTGSRHGYVLGSAVKSGSGWSVPAMLYARKDGTYRFQQARADLVPTSDGRLEAAVSPTSEIAPLETIADAQRFLTEILGEDVGAHWPTYLPAGTTLNRQWPVDAYSWDGRTTVTLHMELAKTDGEDFRRSLNVAFGDVSFSLGCGGEIDPQPGTVGGEPALFDQLGDGPQGTKQVLWPATPAQPDTGSFSVYGELPRSELELVAASMAR